jgi:peptidoglycan hydrolase-like protein with peptidoglycan-binding domain
LGHYRGTLDDIYGYGTQAAVLDFQTKHSLVRDGIAGPRTLKAIRQATKNLTPPQKSVGRRGLFSHLFRND